MNKFVISVDSACDMSAELIEKYNVSVIPLHVTLGDKEYFDGVDITVQEVYAYTEEHKKPPKTSAVSVGEFVEYFEKLLKDNEAVVHFSITGESSATHQNAALAAAEFDNVYAIDSRCFSAGSSILAIKGAELIEELGVEKAVEEIKKLTEISDGGVILETLEYMKYSGRCSSVTTLGANLLGIKPALDVVNGAFVLGKKYRGKYNVAVKKYIADRFENVNVLDRRVAIAEGCVGEELLTLIKEAILETGKVDEILVMQMGCVISAHVGPNAFGIVFYDTNRQKG